MDPCKKPLTEYLKCVNKYTNTNVCKYLLDEYNFCILNKDKYMKDINIDTSLDIIKTYK